MVLVMVSLGTIGLAACGEESLAASSSCSDFMNASPEEQAEAISSLAAEYETPDLATPLGAPNVSAACASDPEMTLGDYFQRWQESEG
jgi:hypothetical protein